MQDYRLTVRLLSPLGTPWQSDTVFGHLAWQVAYGRGPCSIEEFLEPFRRGEPPFVLSDGFPRGLMPRPLLPEVPAGDPTPEAYAMAKQRRKCRWVSADDFAAIAAGSSGGWHVVADPWVAAEVPHAAINRLTECTTGTPEQEEERRASGAPGNLYATTVRALAPGHADQLDLYVRAGEEWVDRVDELLRLVSVVGFGRDRSTGCGAFEVLGDPEPVELGPPEASADGFVSLSTYVPAAGDPVDGRWQIRLKKGQLGEGTCSDSRKYPLLQLEPGAVFRTGGPPRAFYGRAVEGIAPGMPEAIQCGYALAVPCQIGRWSDAE